MLKPGDELVEELKQQLFAVHSILAALAIPVNYHGLAVFPVTHAFYTINEVLRAHCHAASETSSARTESGSVSPTPSETDSSAALERQNTISRDGQSPAPDFPQSPFLKFMNKLDTELGAKAAKMKKHLVKLYIEQRWDADALGEPSAHKVEMMATLMRPPEAQKGRAKPES